MKSSNARHRLNAQDEYFLDTDTTTAPTHIGALEIYHLPPGAGRDFMQKYYAQIRRLPVRAEPFNFVLSTLEDEADDASRGALDWLRKGAGRGRKATGVRAWKRLAGINPEEHIYLHALPYPGGQRELGELVARLHVNRLDRSRPLWEMHLIEGLEGGRYAVYMKLHHSQFDGKRGVALAQYTRSTDPSVRGLLPIWAVDLDKRRARAPAGKRAAPAEADRFGQLAAWGKALSKIRAVRGHAAGDGVIVPYTAPASILNGPLTPRRRLGTVSLPIPRIRALAAAVEGGATVNEVLLAVCGGALRRYLKDRDALPREPLIAACPVALARKEDAAAGNAVGQILVSLETHVGHPMQRLRGVVESSRANKALMQSLDQDAYFNYLNLTMMPQALGAKTRYGHKVLNANLVISNVPGPRDTQYVNGARMEAIYAASMLLPGQALNITVSNVGDNLDVGILACPDLCPSPQRIAVYAGEELAILEQAMGIVPARGKRKIGPKKAAKPRAPRKHPDAKARPAKRTGAKRGSP